MTPPTKVVFRFGCYFLVLVIVGCSGSGHPELEEVEGTVTLGGAPLEGATVEFRPLDEEQRGAVGTTDERGRYELTYIRDHKGVPLGKYKVLISTALDPETGEEAKERVPPRYNSNTELAAEVNEGEQTFDFALKTR